MKLPIPDTNPLAQLSISNPTIVPKWDPRQIHRLPTPFNHLLNHPLSSTPLSLMPIALITYLSLPSSNPNSQSRSQSLFQTSFFLSLQYISSRSYPCLPFPYPNFFTFPLSSSYLTLPCSLPLVSVQQFKYNNTQPAYQPNAVQVMMDRWMQRIIRWGRSVYT